MKNTSKMNMQRKGRVTMCALVALIIACSIVIIATTLLQPLPSTRRTPERQRQQQRQKQEQGQHQQPYSETPLCTFITPPTGQWSYNSRSFCYYPTACLSSSLHLPTQRAQCRLTSATLRPHGPAATCTASEISRITCAYTPGLVRGKPTCAAPAPLPIHQPQLSNAVFLPHYPFPANIYHFANVYTTLSHILSLHAWHNVTLVIHSTPNANAWQTHFQRIILSHLTERLTHLDVVYHPTGAPLCAERVLLLGRRGHVNVWPFPNTTAITPLATQVPLHSVTFRRYFYSTYNITHALPTAATPTLGLPPLTLGYARRLGPGAAMGGNVHAIGTSRRFSHDDDAWFQAMLRNETARYGVQLRVFTTSSSDPLREQVRNFASLGGVIGIHGANLVNAMFMPPLSALIEMFPTDVSSKCYYAGGNAGLRYYKFESFERATPEESGCYSGRCLVLARQRLVKIGRPQERERLVGMVRQALHYLVGLRKRFPRGVPVEKDLVEGMYNIVE